MFDAKHEQQCWDNHVLLLNVMRARSGLSADEAVCVLSCLPWGWMLPEHEAHRVLRGMMSAFGRGRQTPERSYDISAGCFGLAGGAAFTLAPVVIRPNQNRCCRGHACLVRLVPD